MIQFLVALQSGLALAGIYALIAVGFTLILGVSGVFNFLQGSILMLTTLFVFELTAFHGWPDVGALFLLLVFGLACGVATYLGMVRPVANRARDLVETTLLTTVGASTAVNALAGNLFGSNTQPVSAYVSEKPINIGSFPLSKVDLVVVAATVILTIVYVQVMSRTEIGRVTRITLEDPEGARLLGIKTTTVILFSFAVAGLLTALAGWLVAPIISASAYSAYEVTFYAFAAMAIGGFGSFGGAFIGALAVGLAAALTPVYLSPQWTDIIIIGLVAGILVIRPSGILGTSGLYGSVREREV